MYTKSQKVNMNLNYMTKLSEHIPIEYIKKSEKLKKIFSIKDNPTEKDIDILDDIGGKLSIYEIIDNAEELFGDCNVGCDNCKTDILISIGCKCDEYLMSCNYEIINSTILTMCQQDRSIEEISEYIIKNIKE